MTIDICPYAPEHVEAVKALNRRLAAKASSHRFFEEATPKWLPRHPDRSVWREYYVAVESGGGV